jgi:hypothetical protein
MEISEEQRSRQSVSWKAGRCVVIYFSTMLGSNDASDAAGKFDYLSFSKHFSA